MASRRILIGSLVAALFAALIFFYDGTGRAGLPAQNISPRPAYAAPAADFKIYLPLVLRNGVSTNALWRFGVARARRDFTDYPPVDVTAMRFGWYVDFGLTSNAPQPYGIQYVPTVRLKQWKVVPNTNPPVWTAEGCAGCDYALTPSGNYTYTLKWTSFDTIRSFAAARSGMTWLIGNEIERVDWAVDGYQDEILPEVYAAAYHDIHDAIKTADRYAKIAIGGMVQATPLRLKYLDRVWASYLKTYSQTMPVDVWNIHGFVLPEKSCRYYEYCSGAEIPAGLTESTGVTYDNDSTYSYNKNFAIVAGNINALRTWMKQHGEQNKPLIVSEYGVLYPDWVSPGTFTHLQVRDSFMYPSFEFFRNTTDVDLGFASDGYRLVQRWNWYSLDDDSLNYSNQPKFNGNLFNSGLASNLQGIAPLGNHWKLYVQPLPPGSNPPY